MATAVALRRSDLEEEIQPQPQLAPKRSLALDALRGFAILGMILSGSIPFGVFPDWMYHAQIPPPLHHLNPRLAGITWVDLVFPFFLFSMGAAIPLALSKRIEQGTSYGKILRCTFCRGLLLGGFALYAVRVNPWGTTQDPSVGTLLLSLLGFALLFPVLARLPRTWKPWLRITVKTIGWVGSLVFLVEKRFSDGSGFMPFLHQLIQEHRPGSGGLAGAIVHGLLTGGFTLNHSDLIMLVLANVAVFGTLVWLVSQHNTMVRLGALGVLIAFRLSSPAPGWVNGLYDMTPAPWLFRWEYLQYLYIVIPGTIAGDLILRWIRSEESWPYTRGWSAWRYGAITALMLAFIVVMLIGLKERWFWQTTFSGVAMCALGAWLFSNPTNHSEKLLKDLFTWGAYWLILGLAFEPYEGGIKKEHATMSYYFVTTGLALFFLIALTVTVDVFRKTRWLQLVIDNGQNPMLAYVARTSFIPPILALIALNNSSVVHASETPLFGLARGVLVTLLVAVVVRAFTRRKVFWRA